jgi:hypothetical protein
VIFWGFRVLELGHTAVKIPKIVRQLSILRHHPHHHREIVIIYLPKADVDEVKSPHQYSIMKMS